MKCRNARSAIVQRGLGRLGPGTEALLCAHLERCPSCAAIARREEQLDAALALLQEAPPFTVSVVERVMGTVDTMTEPQRDPIPGRQLAWAGAAAAAAAFAVLAMGALLAPAILGIARDAGKAALATGGFLAVLAWAWIETLSSLRPLVQAAWDLLATASVLMRTAQPLVVAAAAVVVFAMLTMTAAVIGRDLKSRIPTDRR